MFFRWLVRLVRDVILLGWVNRSPATSLVLLFFLVIGAVIGAMTLTLAASFLSFLRLPPDWQIGAQGGILILVLALRAIINRSETRS